MVKKNFETVERELMENIEDKTREFSLLDFFTEQRGEKAVIDVTDTQVICAITPANFMNRRGKPAEWRHSNSHIVLHKKAKIDHYPLILLQLLSEDGRNYAYEFVYESGKKRLTPKMKEIREKIIGQIEQIDLNTGGGIDSYLDSEYEPLLIDNPNSEDAIRCGIGLTEFLRHLKEEDLRIEKMENDKARCSYLDDQYWLLHEEMGGNEDYSDYDEW